MICRNWFEFCMWVLAKQQLSGWKSSLFQYRNPSGQGHLRNASMAQSDVFPWPFPQLLVQQRLSASWKMNWIITIRIKHISYSGFWKGILKYTTTLDSATTAANIYPQGVPLRSSSWTCPQNRIRFLSPLPIKGKLHLPYLKKNENNTRVHSNSTIWKVALSAVKFFDSTLNMLGSKNNGS